MYITSTVRARSNPAKVIQYFRTVDVIQMQLQHFVSSGMLLFPA